MLIYTYITHLCVFSLVIFDQGYDLSRNDIRQLVESHTLHQSSTFYLKIKTKIKERGTTAHEQDGMTGNVAM